MEFDVIYLERTESTNSYAKQLLKESRAKEGTVILAYEQFSGRGLGDNSWHSQQGMNLTFSLILEPLFLTPVKQFILNKAIAFAVSDSVRKLLPSGINAPIKWPNDIYVGNRKIGGILIEHNLMGASIKNSVIGIGINLNQAEFPASLPNPVSLRQLTGKEYETKLLLGDICENISRVYSGIQKGESAQIEIDYNASLLGFERELEFTSAGSSFKGRIMGVDDLGRLSVMTADGVVRAYNHGEISVK